MPKSVEQIGDDVWLSQFGEKPPGEPFRDRLRIEDGETEVSMIWGRMDADQASLVVRHFLSPFRMVRYTRAGTLRSASFQVIHSPTKRNPLHVSVYPPSEQGGDADWDDARASKFRACFERDPHEGPGEGDRT